MSTYLIISLFIVIAVMRVIQKVCSKVSSNEIKTQRSFYVYGIVYYGLASVFAFASLAFVGFYGFNAKTVISSVLTAFLFAVDLFTGIEVIKGCSLVVASMFAFGGLIISVIVSYFWFDENVSVYQIFGLVLFFVSAYLLSANSKRTNQKLTPKTFVLLIISFVANGLIMVVQKYFSLKIENGNVSLYSFLTFFLSTVVMLICYFVVRLKTNGTVEKTGEKDINKTIFLCGVLLAVAIFVVNFVVTEMGKTLSSVILFPVSSAISILITTLVGLIVFKEKLTVKNAIGLVLGFLSIIVISVLTPENIAKLF